MHPPVFCFDLGSPYAYLAAERVDALMPVPVEWRPVLLGGLFRAAGRGSWALTSGRGAGMREIERRAARYGLPPIVWPSGFPGDGLLMMRVAVAARMAGIGERFAHEAFRMRFAEGAALEDADDLTRAVARCGVDPVPVVAAAADPAVKAELRRLTALALAAGAVGVPVLLVPDGRGGEEVFWGDDRLEDAAEAVRAAVEAGD